MAKVDRTAPPDRTRQPHKLGAEKLTPAEQKRRFIEAARELGTDNGEALDAAFGKIVPPKLPKSKQET